MYHVTERDSFIIITAWIFATIYANCLLIAGWEEWMQRDIWERMSLMYFFIRSYVGSYETLNMSFDNLSNCFFDMTYLISKIRSYFVYNAYYLVTFLWLSRHNSNWLRLYQCLYNGYIFWHIQINECYMVSARFHFVSFDILK